VPTTACAAANPELRIKYDVSLDVLAAVIMKSLLGCNILSVGVSDFSEDHIAFIYTVVEAIFTPRRVGMSQYYC
jgi:hypothetical protein